MSEKAKHTTEREQPAANDGVTGRNGDDVEYPPKKEVNNRE